MAADSLVPEEDVSLVRNYELEVLYKNRTLRLCCGQDPNFQAGSWAPDCERGPGDASDRVRRGPVLVRYLNQGRAEGDCPHLFPRRAARLLLTRAAGPMADRHDTHAGITAACPDMTALASLVRSFDVEVLAHAVGMYGLRDDDYYALMSPVSRGRPRRALPRQRPDRLRRRPGGRQADLHGAVYSGQDGAHHAVATSMAGNPRAFCCSLRTSLKRSLPGLSGQPLHHREVLHVSAGSVMETVGPSFRGG